MPGQLRCPIGVLMTHWKKRIRTMNLLDFLVNMYVTMTADLKVQ